MTTNNSSQYASESAPLLSSTSTLSPKRDGAGSGTSSSSGSSRKGHGEYQSLRDGDMIYGHDHSHHHSDNNGQHDNHHAPTNSTGGGGRHYMSHSHAHHHQHEEQGQEANDPHAGHIHHEIGKLGSFVLIMNNLTGPAMLGFPNLFQQAGIIPVVCAIVFVCISSSFCGTFLADSIASIPGNQHFRKNIDFSSAFRHTVGEDWYVVAETLFLIACGVQACAGIVGAAQSLDGFLASFLLGKTYAIQMYPEIKFISWDTSGCISDVAMDDPILGADANGSSSSGNDCTPFQSAGPLIFTLGFFLTSCLFLPLGRGHLQETIAAQLISFAFFIILLIQFSSEFVKLGLDSDNIVWFGDDLSQLAGVVLFNYAFSITVPAWLTEKDVRVSVNQTIWSASISGSLIYVLFGIMGGMAFNNVSPNILILLASAKVHWFTRLCAALFGVTIIGCGVPVFCVIIRTALTNNRVCSSGWADFWGAFMPYLLSWTIYQGTMLMSMLNWTGLVVNGLVAFILPMILALKSTEVKTRRAQGVEMIVQPYNNVPTSAHGQSDPIIDSILNPSTTSSSSISRKRSESQSARATPSGGEDSNGSDDYNVSYHQTNQTGIATDNGDSSDANNDYNEGRSSHQAGSLSRVEAGRTHLIRTRIWYNDTVHPLPRSLEIYRREIVLFMILSFTTIIVITIMEDLISGIEPPQEKRRRLMFWQ